MASQRAIADLWRRVGRFVIAVDADNRLGDVLWRRLYLTEVAPWADYAEGDEFRFLGITATPETPRYPAWGRPRATP